MNLMGSYALLYVVNTRMPVRPPIAIKITDLMDNGLPCGRISRRATVTNLAVPMNGAFFNMTLAFGTRFMMISHGRKFPPYEKDDGFLGRLQPFPEKLRLALNFT